ncbi:unnamed protein product [Spirodela intermedia]|uniref:Uncharacterized protein n=1 Tax=Spirodela intermedia TaxID=51605 RepID=A0A7I8J453_SPIIN|nr:unnamed protein product [Spirodela intermedia]CAA6664879.1 unnamed protein product [Spirodela intermedia]
MFVAVESDSLSKSIFEIGEKSKDNLPMIVLGGKTATLRLSGGCHSTERSWMEVGRVLGSFILKSAQQEEALHRICLLPDYASDPLAGPQISKALEV